MGCKKGTMGSIPTKNKKYMVIHGPQCLFTLSFYFPCGCNGWVGVAVTCCVVCGLFVWVLLFVCVLCAVCVRACINCSLSLSFLPAPFGSMVTTNGRDEDAEKKRKKRKRERQTWRDNNKKQEIGGGRERRKGRKEASTWQSIRILQSWPRRDHPWHPSHPRRLGWAYPSSFGSTESS